MKYKSNELFEKLQNKSNLNRGLEHSLSEITGLQTKFNVSSGDIENQVSDAVTGPVADFINSSTMNDILDTVPEYRQGKGVHSLIVSHDVPIAVAGSLAEELRAPRILVATPQGAKFIRTEAIQKIGIDLQHSLQHQIEHTLFKSQSKTIFALENLVDNAWKRAIIAASSFLNILKCPNTACGFDIIIPPRPDECPNCHVKLS